MADFYLKEGDREPSLIAICVDENREVIDLTAATQVRFNLIDPGGALKVNLGVGSFVAPPSSGKVKYDWGVNDTNDPGKYNGEFVVTWSGGKETRFPNYKYILIDILKKIA